MSPLGTMGGLEGASTQQSPRRENGGGGSILLETGQESADAVGPIRLSLSTKDFVRVVEGLVHVADQLGKVTVLLLIDVNQREHVLGQRLLPSRANATSLGVVPKPLQISRREVGHSVTQPRTVAFPPGARRG
jgi:hypothetical protein